MDKNKLLGIYSMMNKIRKFEEKALSFFEGNKLVCINKAVEIRPILTLSLTYDHRIIDGALAAEFLQYIKSILQNPYISGAETNSFNEKY